MKTTKNFVAIAITSTLVACGGGSSSSGGGSSPAPQTPSAPPLSGTYSGSWEATITFESAGRPSTSDTDSFAISVIVDGQNIEVTDGDFSAAGTLTASNGFNASTGPNYRIEGDGLNCLGELTFAGVVDGTTASGNSLGRLNCNGFGVTLTSTIEGPYTATKAAGKVGGGSSLIGALSRAIKR